MRLVATAPVKDKLINIGALRKFIYGRTDSIRAMPYPPNFSRIAARTIDPAIGASTWALGNQR